MSAYKSPSEFTGGILGVKRILDNHLSKDPSLKNKLDAFVILNLAQSSSHPNSVDLRNYVMQTTKTLSKSKEWDKQFSPSKIEINDREILTYKKVTKVSKAIHSAFNAAVVLAEPNPNKNDCKHFSENNHQVVSDKVVMALSEIEGLSVDRTIKSGLSTQIQQGLEAVTNDKELTSSLINNAKQTVELNQQKMLDKRQNKENNASKDKQNENSPVSPSQHTM